MLQVNCHNPYHQQGNEADWCPVSHSRLALEAGPVCGQSTSGGEEEDEAGGVRSEKNDIRIPGVCEPDSILKKGKR